MKIKIFLFFFGVLSFLPFSLIAENKDNSLPQTIEHLIQHVQTSGLKYIRNGTEHDSISAANHMREKYDYFKASILTPEDFIEKAASKSIMTGKPYLVELPDGTQKRLDEWLLSELENYRKEIQKNNKEDGR